MGRILKRRYGKFAVHETVGEKEKAITPRFKTKNELIEHLCNNGTDWDTPWTREQAENFVKVKYSPPLVWSANGFKKGYEDLGDPAKKERIK